MSDVPILANPLQQYVGDFYFVFGYSVLRFYFVYIFRLHLHN